MKILFSAIIGYKKNPAGWWSFVVYEDLSYHAHKGLEEIKGTLPQDDPRLIIAVARTIIPGRKRNIIDFYWGKS